MKILIACEFSGTVRQEIIARAYRLGLDFDPADVWDVPFPDGKRLVFLRYYYIESVEMSVAMGPDGHLDLLPTGRKVRQRVDNLVMEQGPLKLSRDPSRDGYVFQYSQPYNLSCKHPDLLAVIDRDGAVTMRNKPDQLDLRL